MKTIMKNLEQTGEIACYDQFLLFYPCFQKTSWLKLWIASIKNFNSLCYKLTRIFCILCNERSKSTTVDTRCLEIGIIEFPDKSS